MKNISFRFHTSIRDIRVLWKEYTSKRYKKNVEVMRKMTDFYIRNVLKGRWGEVVAMAYLNRNDMNCAEVIMVDLLCRKD